MSRTRAFFSSGLLVLVLAGLAGGIRFPSSDLTEEGYRQAGEKLFVRARTEITYKDYKYFMVETSSTFKK
jgi:hypothetical protein